MFRHGFRRAVFVIGGFTIIRRMPKRTDCLARSTFDDAMAFQNLNLNNHEEWLRSKGFVWNDATRAWEKPRRTVRPVRPSQSSVTERPLRDAPVVPVQRETLYPGRVLVCIESRRRRLIDPDNLTPKWFVDCLRYCGAIRNDRAEDIEIRVSQTKVATEAEEGTRIVITPL